MKRSYIIIGAAMAMAVIGPAPVLAQGDPECAGRIGPVFIGEPKPIELPPSVQRKMDINEVPENRLPALDPQFIQNAEQPCPGKCLQIGLPRELVVTMQQGQWLNAGDGMIWISDIVVEGAVAVRVHMSNINLPAGARLVAYAPQPIDGVLIMAGPFEGKGMYDDGSLWTQEIPGERVRIECFVPLSPKLNLAQLAPFEIDEVQHVYRDPLLAAAPQEVPTNCTDVTCQASWANQARAVARITYVNGGTFLCTGQLLNAQNDDDTPYFLTANHCISTNGVANTVTCYWLYQTSTCNGAAPSLGSVPTSVGATLLATGAASDFTLLMIDGALPCNLYWLGWLSGSISNGSAGACIHHPGGTWKRIALGTKQNQFGCGGASHIGVDWTGPTGTEPGSSGSAFILPSSGGQVIGQLHCGPSSCESPSNDDYGAFQSTYPNISGLLSGGSDDGFEPNDSCAAAALIGAGTSNSLVVKGADEDWYRISIASGQQLTVSLSFVHANGDVDMTLHAVCGGGSVASSTSATNSELINYTNTGAAADFFLRVYLFGCDTRNNYNMTRSFSTPAPANNNCASATPIGNGTFNFSTIGATTDGPDEPGACNFFSYTQVGADIWYRYTAACTGQVRVSLCDSTYDTKVAVYGSACPASASSIACNDDFCGVDDLRSELTFAAVAGNQYLIRIGGYQGATGTGLLRVTCPANDDCAGAPLITNGAWPYNTAGATTDGPNEPGVCNFFGYTQVGADVWYRYTATCNSQVTVRLCSSNYDTKVAVYLGANCPASAAAIVCNDDACGTGQQLQSRVTFNAASGANYRIRVGGYQGATGAGFLIVTCCPSDVNFDGVTNVQDLLMIINGWGSCVAPPANCQTDINGDLLTNVSDLLAVITGWGPCPP
jgi:hypothetical protein